MLDKLSRVVKLNKGHTKALIIVLMIGLLSVSLFMLSTYRVQKNNKLREANAYGESIVSGIEMSIEKSVLVSDFLKSMYLEYGENFCNDFELVGARMMKEDPTISSLYIAPNAVIEYAYPEDVKESTKGFKMLEDPIQAKKAQEAINTKKTTVAGPVSLVEGGSGFIIRNPIYIDDQFDAFIIVVLDWDIFIKRNISHVAEGNNAYNFAVWKLTNENEITDENGYIYSNCDKKISEDVVLSIGVPNDRWYLSVEPKNGFSPVREMFFMILLAYSLLAFAMFMAYSWMKSSEKMIQSMEFDELTGLYTKHAFYRHARELIDANPGHDFDLIIGDVENFKLINSIHGEKTGDEVLCYLGGTFGKNTQNGICARFGGDQFVGLIIVEEERKEDWLLTMTNEIKEQCPIKNVDLKYGVYEGVNRNLSVSMMCDRALLALKSIKHNYEEVYAKYDGPISKKQLLTRTYENDFEDAIKNDEFVVWFQPKYDTQTEKMVGAEALVRWNRRDGKFVSPGEFIAIFEEDGLIVKLDEYVFRKVCMSIREWLDKKIKVVPISINVSRASMQHDGLVDRYLKIVKEFDIPLELIPIELTESASLHSVDIKNYTEDLKRAGFSLHMDDFGAGFSSLASLNTLPFDVVKLDKSLIDFIGQPVGDEIVRHIVELVHFKQLKIVAEGVENEKQLNTLRKMKCDTIQGYFYSKPRSLDDFVALLKKM